MTCGIKRARRKERDADSALDGPLPAQACSASGAIAPVPAACAVRHSPSGSCFSVPSAPSVQPVSGVPSAAETAHAHSSLPASSGAVPLALASGSNCAYAGRPARVVCVVLCKASCVCLKERKKERKLSVLVVCCVCCSSRGVLRGRDMTVGSRATKALQQPRPTKGGGCGAGHGRCARGSAGQACPISHGMGKGGAAPHTAVWCSSASPVVRCGTRLKDTRSEGFVG